MLAAVSATIVLTAQHSLDSPAFEVASIRFAPERSTLGPLQITASGQVVGRLNLGGIIGMAYGVEGGERIIGASADVSKYLNRQVEVRAKPADTASAISRADILAMTRRLLAERFSLQVRFDTELANVMVLRLAKPGVLGPGLRPAPEGCSRLPPGARPDDASYAEAYQRNCNFTNFRERVRGTSTLAEFANWLSSYTRSRILERTGLEGTFAIDVKVSQASLFRMSREPRNAYPPETGAPSFVDAFNDQLGLIVRRESQPVRMLVVERLGPLIEN